MSNAELLTAAIARLPPRRDRPRQLAPELAYGRHRGPAVATARRAAVAMAVLQRRDGSMFVPLTTRPKSLKHHGGQVSLPGGKVEPGESDLQAAMREFQEELGVSLEHATCCGALPPIYVFGSDNLVSPLVLFGEASTDPWRPDLLEVDQVIEMPLEVIRTGRYMVRVTRTRELRRDLTVVGEFKFRTPAIRYGVHRIWGATAMLLAELADLFPPLR
ncbi:MAG: NUDIX hydrolase [Planctomycetaceae bacterium]